MHSFWGIPEVVSELVLLLPRADQARIARVNSALWEIAIPHIWSDVPDIQLFFKLFPSGLWSKVKEPSMFPPLLNWELQDSDWDRFLFHSKNTKTTYYTTGDLRDVVPTEIWCHPLLSTSFPRLESLFVNAFDDSMDQGPINIIPLLLRPSLRRIEFFADRSTADSPLISTLQSIVENKTPLLEEIVLRLVWNVGSLSGVGAQAIASQRLLRRLTISSLSDIAELAESAKDLPCLEELDIRGGSLVFDLPERNYNELGFRSLTTLTAAGVPASIHSLLRSIGSNRLAQVALTFHPWISGDMSPELIVELQRFRPHLVHLEISTTGSFSWADSEPLLNLAELQTCDLTYPRIDSHEITDDRVRQMVDAWPKLARLRLRVLPHTSHLTLTSLAYIAAHCPNLKKLAITFQAEKATNSLFSWDVDASLFSKNALELFDVMASAFDEGDEERLANVFRSWWPKARLCRSDPEMVPMTRWDIDDGPSWP
ncbi:hypothetical protein M407DRAFT_34275, partial [Tulasnella calospora MUT 4182]